MRAEGVGARVAFSCILEGVPQLLVTAAPNNPIRSAAFEPFRGAVASARLHVDRAVSVPIVVAAAEATSAVDELLKSGRMEAPAAAHLAVSGARVLLDGVVDTVIGTPSGLPVEDALEQAQTLLASALVAVEVPRLQTLS